MSDEKLTKVLQESLKTDKQTLEYTTEQLKMMPDETLRVRNCHGVTEYFCRRDSSETNGQYLGKEKDKKKIQQLEQKDYLEALQRETVQKISIIENTIKLLADLYNPGELFFSIKPEKRHLIDPYLEKIEEIDAYELKKWKREPFNKKGFDKQAFYTTQNGERVRSKSEVIIADRLKASDIPYHYEYKQVFLDEDNEFVAWFPDFFVLNKRTGKEYYWEHFGMMDNAEYCASAQYKIEFFARNGIILGRDLIITMESSKHQLNTQYIDTLIEQYLK